MNVVNHVQEPPSTSLTGEPAKMYYNLKLAIAAWDPFHGVTAATLFPNTPEGDGK